jgi:FtsP/CotA-like multicopper oxidase with cupredoxin domain
MVVITHSGRPFARRAFPALAWLAACSSPPPPPDAGSAPGLPVAAYNDHRTPAGRLERDTLAVELVLVRAAWQPRGSTGPRVAVAAFAGPDRVPIVPAPLIRLQVGTTLRLTITSELDEDVELSSPLGAHGPLASIALAPGGAHTTTWTPITSITTIYRGSVREGGGPDGATMGLLIVDPRGYIAPDDERLLLLSSWGSNAEPGSLSTSFSWKQMVNGRSWPHTERLYYVVGDTVQWRVVNASGVRHPMHLHGFFFDVTSAGNLQRDTAFAPGTRSQVVTHLMTNESSMTMRWVPTTAGNWLFHCHLLRHMGPTQRFAAEGAAADASGMAMDDGMSGLIMGITIHPSPTGEPIEPQPMRRLHLWTGTTPRVYGEASRHAFVLQEGADAPAPDSTVAPSSALMLSRNEPVEIVVHNRMESPLAVHWHGLELRSEYDGVGHWSGLPGHPRPPIAPGDSARVLLQPPRAGTFMYHTHGESGFALSQGLYGPLIVTDSGSSWDANRERMFLLGDGGATRDTDPAINGLLEPPVERFMPGQTYRLRFMQIASDESKIVELRHDGELADWRPMAKDGANLLEGQRVVTPARFRGEVGETFDFDWTPPATGVYQLAVKTVGYPLDLEWGPTQTIAFAVGEVSASAIASAHDGFDSAISLGTLANLILAGVALALLLLLGASIWFARRWRHRRRARRLVADAGVSV